MEIITIETKNGILQKLVPADGKVLTNGEAYNDRGIYLGCNDSKDNWHEITEAEYRKITKQNNDI